MSVKMIPSAGIQKISPFLLPQPKKEALSPEDQKVHRLVAIGNALQIIASLVAAAITIIACVTLMPLALIALVPCIGLHLLGRYMAYLPIEFAHTKIIVSIPDRPLGLPNRGCHEDMGGSNCFANTILQFLVQDPEMHKIAMEAPWLVEIGKEKKQQEILDSCKAIGSAKGRFSDRILKAESWEELDAIREDVQMSDLPRTLKKHMLDALNGALANFILEAPAAAQRLIEFKESLVEKKLLLVELCPDCRDLIQMAWEEIKGSIDNTWQETLLAVKEQQIPQETEFVQKASQVKNLILAYEKVRSRGESVACVEEIQSGRLRTLLGQEEEIGPEEDPVELLNLFLQALTPKDLGEYDSRIGPEILFYQTTERMKSGTTYKIERQVLPILEMELSDDEPTLISLLEKALHRRQDAEIRDDIEREPAIEETTRFIVPPSSLTIQLKRFSMDEFGAAKKIAGPVHNLLSFELPAKFCLDQKIKGMPEYEIPLRGKRAAAFIESSLELPNREEKKGGKYELNFFISHEGETTREGHYIAYVRKQGAKGSQWFCMNDTKISLVSDAVAEKAAETSYMLRYVKVGGEEPSLSPLSSPSLSSRSRTNSSGSEAD